MLLLLFRGKKLVLPFARYIWHALLENARQPRSMRIQYRKTISREEKFYQGFSYPRTSQVCVCVCVYYALFRTSSLSLPLSLVSFFFFVLFVGRFPSLLVSRFSLSSYHFLGTTFKPRSFLVVKECSQSFLLTYERAEVITINFNASFFIVMGFDRKMAKLIG